MSIHHLKIWPEYFHAVVSGTKTFELRKNDRGFACGDTLRLLEFDPERGIYTGNSAWRCVTYVLAGPAHGLEDGYVILALGPDAHD